MNVNFFLITIIFVTLSSCSIPDLNDEDVLKTAKEEAIEISTLTKKSIAAAKIHFEIR